MMIWGQFRMSTEGTNRSKRSFGWTVPWVAGSSGFKSEGGRGEAQLGRLILRERRKPHLTCQTSFALVWRGEVQQGKEKRTDGCWVPVNQKLYFTPKILIFRSARTSWITFVRPSVDPDAAHALMLMH